ncbi:MAG: hydroxymethylglutaryl-CoA lyase [Halobacteriovoraceae bacterium]|nr:hydroxymethylglutaryl-CoA lyase [Halobacteriovoraceae bacterium]|tara:strand:+ start:7365 stop:8282 length:918 start_codon:yes stop_codon:yes gene_type:complete
MFKSLPSKVRIVEVGPRDGLQNEKEILPLEDKLEYIKLLSKTGLDTIEVTSFVSPKAIPQMGDANELFKAVDQSLNKDINKPCLVPNLKGLEAAMESGVSEISLFSATSDSFTKKNINCTVEESFNRMGEVAKIAQDNKIKMRGYVSTAFGCPYEGEVSVDKLLEVVKRFFNLGVYEVSVGDTIGVATPKQVDSILKRLSSEFDKNKLAMHFHDTRGMAVTNVLVSLENGYSVFDASSGGLGGCPYAKGASGNVGTEDLIYLFDSLGIEHGVDMKALVDASKFILEKLNKSTTSKYLKALLSNEK